MKKDVSSPATIGSPEPFPGVATLQRTFVGAKKLKLSLSTDLHYLQFCDTTAFTSQAVEEKITT